MTKIVGIVGGGQLGRMLTQSAHQLGFKVVVLDPTPNSPAGQVADKQIIGSFTDEAKIKELAGETNFITFEIESANAKALDDLSQQGFPVNPSAKALSIIKDKLFQKEFLKKNKIPVADFLPVISENDVKHAADLFGYPFLLKARMDAYDGRGNALILKESEIPDGLRKLAGREMYVERFVPFKQEISVIVARSMTDVIAVYPVSENIHKRNILQMSIMPAEIPTEAFKSAQKFAINVVKHLDGAGVFGIEMFLAEDNQVLVNEIAPRVHNSGHQTIEGSVTSQFEQQIRAITGMELGNTDMKVPAVVMVNILGERNGKADAKGIEKAETIPGVKIHLYGKMESRIDRKMGHLTAVGKDIPEALKRAKEAKKYISI